MKRALLFALILANLGVFAWVHWYVLPARVEPAPAAAPGGQPLQLMSELSPAQKKALGATAAPAPATAQAQPGFTTLSPANTTASGSVVIAAPAPSTGPVLTCASYGPFLSADAAAQALARLKTAGVSASQRELPGKAKLGYWVYLPPFGSRKEAEGATALLKRKGVSDIYVVADEANRNAISLGLFNQREFALQRERQIRKLGFRAHMAERFREEPRYWLDAKGPESALPSADVFKDLSDDAAPVGKAISVCSG